MTDRTHDEEARRIEEIAERVRSHAESGLTHGVWWITDCQTLLTALAAKDAEIERLTAERDADRAVAKAAGESLCKWRAAFQACTPGGSEFMTPEATLEYMQNVKQETVEARIKVVRAEREIADLRAQVERMRGAAKPFIYWRDHIGATGSRRLSASETPVLSGVPTMGQLRDLALAATEKEPQA